MRIVAVMSNGEEVDITDEYKRLEPDIPNKPSVKLKNGEWLNMAFYVRIKRIAELPSFSGGDPYKGYMKNKPIEK